MITHAIIVPSSDSRSDLPETMSIARSVLSSGVGRVAIAGGEGRPYTLRFGKTDAMATPSAAGMSSFASGADEVLVTGEPPRHGSTVSAIVAFLSGKPSPGTAVVLSGSRSGGDGTETVYDRSPGAARYAENDSGDVEVDRASSMLFVAKGGDLAKAISSSGMGAFSSPEAMGAALKSAGVRMVCVDTPEEWARPVRLRTSNVVRKRVTGPAATAANEVAAAPRASFLRRGDPPTDGTIGVELGVVSGGEPLPVLPIVFLTHDRTRVARETVRHLVRNIRYDGPIKWCLCDDRSMPGHVGSIFNLLTELGVDEGDISIFLSTKDRYGLGASMNNGLKYSFGIGDIALTVEDDWILERELDITPYVRVVMSDSRIGIIRLSTCVGVDKSESYNDFLSRVVGNNRYPYVMVHQVALRHRRVYDVLGMYRENCPAGETEKAMSDSYNMRFGYGRDDRCIVLIPSCIKRNALDGKDLYFIHVGLSTIGHSEYNVPLRYAYLYSRERAVVSMTSYPGRISNVARSIKFIMDCQTERPDELHLWLANDEFPEGWRGLPDDLRSELRRPCASLHWVPTNTYCHKRHEVFKWLPDDSCVFLIDDDVRYDDRLVESTMSLHMENPTSVINYERYSEHLYSGRKILYGNLDKFRSPTFRVRMCGQSMIPSMVYPRMSLSPDNVAIRDMTTPINDEPWLQPWLVHSRIPVLNQHFGWGVDIDKKIDHRTGLCRYAAETQENGMSRNDIWLSRVLGAFPAFMNDYVILFGYGNKM